MTKSITTEKNEATASAEAVESVETAEPKKETRHHQLAFVQYERNPKTGESLNFDESNIIKAVSHKTITKYGYARHDQDNKVAGDDGHPDIIIGDPIPPHWQGAIYSKHGVEISTFANWLGIPEFMIKVLHGRNAFIEYIEYLTHEAPKQQSLGKHRYDDSEIHANFPFRTDIDTYRRRRDDKSLSYLDDKEYYRHKVLYDGLTLMQISRENPDIYRKDFRTLAKYRMEYLLRFATLPQTRINYYVNGRGGVGKGLICRAIARNLYRDLKHDEEIFFRVGAKNVTFDGYDGQPVIIWDDFRAFTLLRALDGRENVFDVFDTHPTDRCQHVKFGYLRLINEVNIVNSVDSYTEFLDGLAGEYKESDGTWRHAEDKGQSYRRFPIVLPLHENDFDLFLNKGVLDGSNEFQQFERHFHIRGNMQRIYSRLSSYETELRDVESKIVAPIIKAHNSVYVELSGLCSDPLCEIMEEFKDYGKQDEDACRRDEIQKFEAFLQLQQTLIDEEINYCTNPNSPNYQKALTAQKMIKENPEEFYQKTELHLQVTPFTGAYRP